MDPLDPEPSLPPPSLPSEVVVVGLVELVVVMAIEPGRCASRLEGCARPPPFSSSTLVEGTGLHGSGAPEDEDIDGDGHRDASRVSMAWDRGGGRGVGPVPPPALNPPRPGGVVSLSLGCSGGGRRDEEWFLSSSASSFLLFPFFVSVVVPSSSSPPPATGNEYGTLEMGRVWDTNEPLSTSSFFAGDDPEAEIFLVFVSGSSVGGLTVEAKTFDDVRLRCTAVVGVLWWLRSRLVFLVCGRPEDVLRLPLASSSAISWANCDKNAAEDKGASPEPITDDRSDAGSMDDANDSKSVSFIVFFNCLGGGEEVCGTEGSPTPFSLLHEFGDKVEVVKEVASGSSSSSSSSSLSSSPLSALVPREDADDHRSDPRCTSCSPGIPLAGSFPFFFFFFLFSPPVPTTTTADCTAVVAIEEEEAEIEDG